MGKETKAFALQKWLRAHGPASMREIREAGWRCFCGKTYARMLAYGAVEKFMAANEHSDRRWAHFVVLMYRATDKDYTPHRGMTKGVKRSRESVERAKETRSINVLRGLGYTVIPPPFRELPDANQSNPPAGYRIKILDVE